jgi:Tol biopolymer transport system component
MLLLLFVSGSVGYSFIKTYVEGAPLGLGRYSSPTLSPDGRYVAFAFFSGGPDELWLFEVETGRTTRVNISSNVTDSGMAWLDNYTLYYVANDSLYRADIRTGTSERLIDGAYTWQGFSFDHTRTSVIFSNRELYPLNKYHPANLYSLRLADLSITRLTETADISEEDPKWSPNGKRLAFFVAKDRDLNTGYRGEFGIEIQGLDRKSYTLDLSIPIGINHFAWSPDGEWLIFRANSETESGLYLIRADGNGSQVKVNLRHERQNGLGQVSWSADGSRVAYTSVGVPGKNELCIFTAKELGLP